VGFAVDKVALEQVFREYFSFPFQSSFHQVLHPHNHPGQVKYFNWWPTCRVNPVGLHPPLFELKEKVPRQYPLIILVKVDWKEDKSVTNAFVKKTHSATQLRNNPSLGIHKRINGTIY
jgi:hypothetical protein